MDITEERLYCAKHSAPVEFVPELNQYTCINCEVLLDRGDLITESHLVQKVKMGIVKKRRRPMGEFL